MEDLVRRQKQRAREAAESASSPQERLRLAQEHFSNGNPVNAVAELRPLLIAQPNDPHVLLLAAKCAEAAGQRSDAYNLLEAIDDSNKEMHSDAIWLAAQWLADENRYGVAEQKLKRLLELRINPNRAHRRLAQWLHNQGRGYEAATHLRALARNGDISAKELFALNTISDLFIDDSQPMPDFARGLSPAALVKAKQLWSESDLAAARDLVQQLAAAFPESTQIAAFQGRMRAELHEDENFRQWIRTLPSGIEREPEYWSAMGNWLQRAGRHREAVRCFGEAVLRDETDRYSYVAIARSMRLLGEHAIAERAIQRFSLLEEAAKIANKISRKPGTEEELTRMAEILEQLQRPWEAIAWRSIAQSTYKTADSHLETLRTRSASLREDEWTAKSRFLTCGIDLAAWPLPVLDPNKSSDGLKPETPAREVFPAQTVSLVNVAADADLRFQYDNGDNPQDQSVLLHQMTAGGGIGVIDFDHDGWPDLYLTQGGGEAFDEDGSKPNQFFRNLGGKRFADITESTASGDRGYGQGVAVADINQDGFPDLLVANIGPNLVYVNNGDGTFERRILDRSPDHKGAWTTSLACGDLSGDHLPEIVEVNYIDDPNAMIIACTPERDICNPSVFQPASDHVWEVTSNGSFVRWNGCLDLVDKPNYGFAAIIANFDGVSGNDIFIANDTGHNHFWVSQRGDGTAQNTLSESAHVLGCASGLLGQRQGCMGIAHGDFDRNGRLDLHVTNYWDEAADLYLQQTSGLFVNATASRGLYEPSRSTVGWGTQAVDFNRDGWLDLAVSNGHLVDRRHRGQPYQMRPQLFMGDRGHFHLSTLCGNYWSMPALGRTMAVIDWNVDSKADLVMSHLDVPTALLQNATESGNGIRFELVGTLSERDAVGAKITITCGADSWSNWIIGGHGFLCSNEQVMDFGIGIHKACDRIEVLWPSGLEQVFSDLAVNHRYLIVEGDEIAFSRNR